MTFCEKCKSDPEPIVYRTSAAPTLRDVLVALSLASQIDSLELRERHVGRARVLLRSVREALDSAEKQLGAMERELDRATAAERQAELFPGGGCK